MTTNENQIASLVEAYNNAANGVCKPRVYENSAWNFLQHGFTECELVLVVKWIQKENSRNDFKYSLELRKLLSDMERFNDFLSRATAWKATQRTPRQQVIDNFRGHIKPDLHRDAQSIQNILGAIKV